MYIVKYTIFKFKLLKKISIYNINCDFSLKLLKKSNTSNLR